MNWRKGVARFEREAVAVLKEHKLPTTAEELIARDTWAGDRMIGAAMRIVFGAHYLQKELQRGRCERALNRLFSVCAAYEEFSLLRDVPALGLAVCETQWLYRFLDNGVLCFRGSVNGGNSRATSNETIAEWRTMAAAFRGKNLNASKHSVARHIANKLYEGKKVRTIERHL